VARIAINSGDGPKATDGLFCSQRLAIELALGPEWSARLAPSAELVTFCLHIKLPAEVEMMRRAAVLTEQLELEVYATVVPGVPRDSDLALFHKRSLREGTTFAFDGFFALAIPGGSTTWDEGTKTLSSEEMVVITVTGTECSCRCRRSWCRFQRRARAASGQSRAGWGTTPASVVETIGIPAGKHCWIAFGVTIGVQPARLVLIGRWTIHGRRRTRHRHAVYAVTSRESSPSGCRPHTRSADRDRIRRGGDTACPLRPRPPA
jgi:hypothetical protein